MSDYIGGLLTLLVIAAAIVGVLYSGGTGAPAEGSIIPEAVAAAPAEAHYGWRTATPQYAEEPGEVAEYF